MDNLQTNVTFLVTDSYYLCKISEHFKLSELLQTSQGDRYQDANYSSFRFQHAKNLIRLSLVLEALRRFLGDTALVINSGFRSPLLNARVGGAPKSYHLYGCAADIRIVPTERVLNYLNSLKSLGILAEVIAHDTYIHISIPAYDI